jgi:hypothetical protein
MNERNSKGGALPIQSDPNLKFSAESKDRFAPIDVISSNFALIHKLGRLTQEFLNF